MRGLVVASLVVAIVGCGRSQPLRYTVEDAGCMLQQTGGYDVLDSARDALPGSAVLAGAGPAISWVAHHPDERGLRWTVLPLKRDGQPARFSEVALVTFLPPEPPSSWLPGPVLGSGPGPLTALGQDSVEGARLTVRDPDRWRILEDVEPFSPNAVLTLLRSDSSGLLLLERGEALRLIRLSPADGSLLAASSLERPADLVAGFETGFNGVDEVLVVWPILVQGKIELEATSFGLSGPTNTWRIPTVDFGYVASVTSTPEGGWYVAWGGAREGDFSTALEWAVLFADGTARALDWGTFGRAFSHPRVSQLDGTPLFAVVRPGAADAIELSRVTPEGAREPVGLTLAARNELRVDHLELLKLSEETTAVVTWQRGRGGATQSLVRLSLVECLP